MNRYLVYVGEEFAERVSVPSVLIADTLNGGELVADVWTEIHADIILGITTANTKQEAIVEIGKLRDIDTRVLSAHELKW